MSAEPKVRLLLLGHAPLASAFRELAVHAFPECGLVLEDLDVGPDEAPDALQQRITAWLDRDAPRQTLVLVDVFGASPCNALQPLQATRPWLKTVAGLNLPMLWRVLCYRHEALEALVERAEQGGKRGIILVDPSN